MKRKRLNEKGQEVEVDDEVDKSQERNVEPKIQDGSDAMNEDRSAKFLTDQEYSALLESLNDDQLRIIIRSLSNNNQELRSKICILANSSEVQAKKTHFPPLIPPVAVDTILEILRAQPKTGCTVEFLISELTRTYERPGLPIDKDSLVRQTLKLTESLEQAYITKRSGGRISLNQH
eukprot:TRINITY_DN15374_c0_g1_i1.p1 TRINITY_DN15374_c0_g1~~TRINITY_DN15374_c0_g1_i1.p1  ORF type:complete len:185 (-),score=48.55 TRINITY_DN15374_c0_g1_i1:31-561(-)